MIPPLLKVIARATWNFLQNLLPVERWVASVTNALRLISLAFLVLVI